METDGEMNKKTFIGYVDQFIRGRRFENLTLHAVIQDMKVDWSPPLHCITVGHLTGSQLGKIPWLRPLSVAPSVKISRTDLNKRKELFLELLYYIFDSLLVPLIRSNFHVTESNAHRHRLFYFRHDVWRLLTEPSMTNLKLTMFDEIPTQKAKLMLDSRVLGFSQIRLVPKGVGVRPIVNLKRRATMMRNGKLVFGRAINFHMKPVHSMLSYERSKRPDLLGSSLFSVGDLYHKIKAFQSRMQGKPNTGRRFYFAKVDVQSCFDTIPQQEAIKVIERICSEDDYRIARHAELKSSDLRGFYGDGKTNTKPSRKFLTQATAASNSSTFEKAINQDLACGKEGTVFVDLGIQTLEKRKNLLKLLEEHVRRNIVKIGKKFFRQKQGIPQGSVLSSLLCNFFYADFERECLAPLEGEDSLLLRLIDDFLLITTCERKAKDFVQIMHDGTEAYGIQVRPEKTLVSFGCNVNGMHLNHLDDEKRFPYCGIMIDTNTLEITKDRGRRTESGKHG